MIFKKPTLPSQAPDFESAVKQYAPELLQAIYRGVLNRDADDDGLLHHSADLRAHGDLSALLRTIAQSEELLKLSAERMNRHLVEASNSLPPSAQKISIIANCQGSAFARSIQALTGTRPPAYQFVACEHLADQPERGVDYLRRVLAASDVVLMQPNCAEIMLARVPELKEKLRLFPIISFAAFHPDLCHVRIAGQLVEAKGPMDNYQSSLVYYAWRLGMSEREAADLFCDAVYRHLRFYDYWDSASRAMLDEGHRAGLPLDAALHDWRRQGCFMHAPAHPKLAVIADLARRVLTTLDVPMLPLDPASLLWDDLAEWPVWPVYPEIARHLGFEGSYLFKGRNRGLVARAAVVAYDLQGFIHQAYADYARYAASHELSCSRDFTVRYQEVFGKARQGAFVSLAMSSDQTATAPRRHPYQGLPARQYWNAAVQRVPAAEVDPVATPSFTITPDLRVASAGSCFAQHISARLKRHRFNFLQTESAPSDIDEAAARQRHYGVYSARYGNLYTARQLLQLFERAYGVLQPAEPGWLRADGRLADPFRPEIEPEGYADETTLNSARTAHLAAVREMFETLDVFVFTLGLTEAWRSKIDGAVFPLAPGVVAGAMDPDRHEWVNFSVSEVTADLDCFIERLAEKNPRAKVLLTVSPVPLAATHDDRHVLVATTYSKSVLRVAAEEMTHRHAHCSYFPSFEIITGHYNRGSYFSPDLRSVNAAGVDHVMRLFFTHHAPLTATDAVDLELLADANWHYHLACEENRLLEGGA